MCGFKASATSCTAHPGKRNRYWRRSLPSCRVCNALGKLEVSRRRMYSEAAGAWYSSTEVVEHSVHGHGPSTAFRRHRIPGQVRGEDHIWGAQNRSVLEWGLLLQHIEAGSSD